jgi:hypothetical protein
MDSDHVEDVFAEDNVIRRDIFRTLRDGLFSAPAEGVDAVEEQVQVRLDTLGYVAATVSKLASASAMREALGRAAELVQAHFTAYSAEDRAATFLLEDGDPDGRLELEEAIADELTDLVEAGLVDLPTIERTIDLGRALPPAEHRALAARIDAAGQQTILRGGCVASWDMEDARTLAVSFTPLSDQDARDVDQLVAAFARELKTIVGERPAVAVVAADAKPSPSAAKDAEPAPPTKRPRAAAKAEPAKKAAAKKVPAAKKTPAGKAAVKPASKAGKPAPKKR